VCTYIRSLKGTSFKNFAEFESSPGLPSAHRSKDF
jgi:hypothetical protein